MNRWLAYLLMSASLAGAVVLSGGVVPERWQWSALGLSAGALVWIAGGPERVRAPGGFRANYVIAALAAWYIFQLVPLPPSILSAISPHRWGDVSSARAILQLDAAAWAPLSVAPPMTTARLLNVLPAMAVFLAAREMAWFWRDRLWISVAPIVAFAWLESLLGLTQFYYARMGTSAAASSTGTYVNRNHFAGLLELAFPVAVLWGISIWRRNITRDEQPLKVGLAAAALLAAAGCILMGIVLSLSRMGFVSTLAASALTGLLCVSYSGSQRSRASRLRWMIPILVLISILVFLPTDELINRFSDMSADEEVGQQTRAAIWRSTLPMARDYAMSGCGLGAFEQCFYPYKTVAPVNTIDFAHNDYLQLLSETGIIGVALAATLGGWIGWRVLRAALERDRRNWEFAVGLLAALVAVAMHSLADFNLYIPANAAALAWFSGIAASPGLRA